MRQLRNNCASNPNCTRGIPLVRLQTPTPKQEKRNKIRKKTYNDWRLSFLIRKNVTFRNVRCIVYEGPFHERVTFPCNIPACPASIRSGMLDTIYKIRPRMTQGLIYNFENLISLHRFKLIFTHLFLFLQKCTLFSVHKHVQQG